MPSGGGMPVSFCELLAAFAFMLAVVVVYELTHPKK
jgi:hypothetical protein